MKTLDNQEAKDGVVISTSEQETKDTNAQVTPPKQRLEYYQKLARFLNTVLNQAQEELPTTDRESSLLGGIEPFIIFFKNTLAEINKFADCHINTNSLAVQHFNLALLMSESTKKIPSLHTLKNHLIAEPNPLVDEDTSDCKEDLIKMLVTKSNKPLSLYNESISQLGLSIQTYLAINTSSLSPEDKNRLLNIACQYINLPSTVVDFVTLDRILTYLDTAIEHSKELDRHWNLILTCLSKLVSCKLPPSSEEKYLGRLKSLLAIIDESEFNYDFAVIYKGLLDRHLLKNEFQLAEDLRVTTIQVLKKSNKPQMIEYYATTYKKNIADKRLAYLKTSSTIPKFMHSNVIKLPPLKIEETKKENPTISANNVRLG